MRRVVAIVVLLVAGCVEKEPAVDQSYVKANLLSAAPTPNHPVNGDFGGKVVYLGADLDKDTVAPGDKITLVHYWKVLEAPGSEWRAFTHVNGLGKDWMNVDETKMRKGYGPDRWKAGDIVKDEQTITLKKEWGSPFAAIYVGLYKKGGHSEKDRMPVVSGPNDGKSRILVAKLTVTGVAAQTPQGPPQAYVIRKAAGPITIDGKADEASWKDAASTGEFKEAEGAPVKTSGPTSAKLLWDAKNLYAWIDIQDTDIDSPYTKTDDPLWQADVVEFFIDADKNRRGYVELQTNPNNAHFDTWFAVGRPNRDDSFDAKLQSVVTKDDKAWHVEIAIPLEAVKGKDPAMAVTLPPRPGDSWKLNIVRVDKNKSTKDIAASAWAQIPYSDFHAIDRLMTVTFGDESGKAAAVDPGQMRPIESPLTRPGAPPITLDPLKTRPGGVPMKGPAAPPATAPTPAPAPPATK
jgi:hypothetical protein